MPDDSGASPDIGGIRDVLPETDLSAERKHGGGTHTHKVGCQCYPCKARRRKEEALAESARARRGLLATPGSSEAKVLEQIIDADDTVYTTFPIEDGRKATPRARIAFWVAARSERPTITVKEVAKQLQISPKTLERDIIRAHKGGWLRFEDPLARVEYGLIPKVLDNLEAFLDAKDKTVTIETAKGTLFKQYQEAKGISEQQSTVLAIKIEAPKDGEERVITGQILGRPKAIEADIEDE